MQIPIHPSSPPPGTKRPRLACERALWYLNILPLRTHRAASLCTRQLCAGLGFLLRGHCLPLGTSENTPTGPEMPPAVIRLPSGVIKTPKLARPKDQERSADLDVPEVGVPGARLPRVIPGRDRIYLYRDGAHAGGFACEGASIPSPVFPTPAPLHPG